MGNRPVNFNDPTGHFECNDPHGCNGPDDDNAESGVVIGGGGGGGGGNHDDDNDDDDDDEDLPTDIDLILQNELGTNSCSMNVCVSSIYDLSSLDGVLLNNRLHPSDIIFNGKNTFGAYVPVYSPNGNLIGYRVARYSPDYSTIRINVEAINLWKYIKMTADNVITSQLVKTVEIIGSEIMFSCAKKLSVLSTVYDISGTANELIIFDGEIQITGPIMVYPQNIVSFPSPSVYFGIPVP